MNKGKEMSQLSKDAIEVIAKHIVRCNLEEFKNVYYGEGTAKSFRNYCVTDETVEQYMKQLYTEVADRVTELQKQLSDILFD